MNKKLQINFNYKKNATLIDFNQKSFLIGSCFSDNIYQKLIQRKLQVKSNPFGVLFDILSIERCLNDIISKKVYLEKDLFFYNELFGSWNHHSQFSNTDSSKVLDEINQTILDFEIWLKSTKNIIITLGSAFAYKLNSENKMVANCHKLPANEFTKELLSINQILSTLENIYKLLKSINPEINLILTISPVRHLRDGVVENNRSKARLIEAEYQFRLLHPEVYYFPAYEIVIDVLRDYRFYDIDFAHPNYLATDIVFDYFRELCIDPTIWGNMEAFFQLDLALNHRSRNPDTQAHKKFIVSNLEKAKYYQSEFPYLNFSKEIEFFSN